MNEKLSLREIVKTRVAQARRTASIVIKDILEGSEAVEEQERQQKLAEARLAALNNPNYRTLRINLEYKKWLKGELKASEWRDPTHLFPEIKANIPVNEYMPDAWKERAIDPDISETDLHQKCVEYCDGTAQKFVDNATKFAELFATGQRPADTEHMKHAIGGLIGTSWEHTDNSIFIDRFWSASNYSPDYLGLETDPAEMSVSHEKVMAGVGLCIGLWVRLADEGATRPVSGHDFAPPFLHCSFSSLVRDTGWAEYTNDTLFKGIATSPEESELFLAPFRAPDFFENTLQNLQESA